MKKQAVIRTLPEALRLIKNMNLTSEDQWTGDYRDQARESIANVLKCQMEESIHRHLAWIFGKGIPDRKNGTYVRTVLTELGSITLSIPRTRLFSPKGVN